MGALEKFVDGSKREEALKSKERHETANRLMDDSKFDDAIVLYRENLEWSLKTLGKSHNCTVSDQEALAQAFYSARNFEEARKLDQAALTTRASVEGTDPPSKELLEVQLSLAQDNVGLKKYREAAKIYEDVYKRYKADDIQGLKVGYDLAACWHHSRNYEKSQDLNQKILQQRIKIGASEEQIAQSREALKQNLKKIESTKKKKEAAEKKAAEKSDSNMKSTDKTELSDQEKSKRTGGMLGPQAQTNADVKGIKGKKAEMKDEKEHNRLDEVEARALERERLAREARILERKEMWEKLENETVTKARPLRKEIKHTEATKEASKIPFKRAEGRAPMSLKDSMTEARLSVNPKDDYKYSVQEQQSVPKSTNYLKGAESKPINNEQDNSRRRASSHGHQPLPRFVETGSDTNHQHFDKVWLAGRKKNNPGSNPFPFNIGSENARTPHVRSSSQDSRDVTDKIQFRHVSMSDMFRDLQSAQKLSSSVVGGTSPSIPGLFVSEHGSKQQPVSMEIPQRPKTVPVDPGKANRQNLPLSSAVIPERAPKFTPDLSRSRSVDNQKGKDAMPARSKSVSPSAGQNTSATKAKVKPKVEIHQSQLFDAKGGQDDEDSAYSAQRWFQCLESETQELLSPLRRTRGKRVKIAILDTGIDLAHPDFKEDQAASGNRRIKAPEDFLDPDGTAHDTCGHGTHCVGLLRKVAPYADIFVARVAKDFKDNLKPDVVAQAIVRACSDGKDKDGKRNWNVDIITMSFGFYNITPVVRNAIRQALARPVLIFAAASNNGIRRDVAFPASMTGVFCINSASGDGGPSRFNPLLKPDKSFSIIGENITSSWTTHNNAKPQRSMTGTSVATPIAAAVAALVLEYVLQNDPESFLLEQLDEFKEYDGMSKIFSLMSKMRDGYKNIVPWELLTIMAAKRRSITGRMEWEMKGFGGQ